MGQERQFIKDNATSGGIPPNTPEAAYVIATVGIELFGDRWKPGTMQRARERERAAPEEPGCVLCGELKPDGRGLYCRACRKEVQRKHVAVAQQRRKGLVAV